MKIFIGCVAALAIVAVLALVAVRLVSGQSLHLRSAVTLAVDHVASMVKAAADSQRVRTYSQGNHTNVVFLHHSVGNNLLEQGNLRQQMTAAGFSLWDHDYNGYGLTRPDGQPAGYSYNVPGDNTDPDGLAGIFKQPVLPLPLNTFSGLLQHEVIVFKSCFPASQIESDEELEQYKAYYLAMRDVMDQHPDKAFILLTTPPLNPVETNAENGARSRALADWLTSDAFRGGRPNLFVFDLFNQLAQSDPSSPEYNMLRADYRDSTDSHPNQRANETISPILADFIADSVESFRAGRGSAGSLPPLSSKAVYRPAGAAASFTPGTAPAAPAATDWPQVQNTPQRTGYSPEVLGTTFRVKWTHPFQPERVYPQVQAIVYAGKVYVGTANGNLYALNIETGAQAWKFAAGAPILNSVAASDGKVFFGAMDGAVYALNAANGALVWKNQVSTRLGISTAPVLADNKVMLGGRNGIFYALNPATGSIVWQHNVGAPILQTAAWNDGRAYFGAMDMHVYAIHTSNGARAWRSAKIPGMAFKDYWPVVHRGKVYVIPMSRTGLGVTDWTQVLNQAAQQAVLADYAAHPENYEKAMVALNEATGVEAPAVIYYPYQSMHGATAPPCVDRDGMFIVPALSPASEYRTGWGRLNVDSRILVELLSDGTQAGFGAGDETFNVTCTANLVLTLHTEEGNAHYTGAFNLATRTWTHIAAGYRNGQFSTNTQGGGGNPGSVADGVVYHISYHELIARSTTP